MKFAYYFKILIKSIPKIFCGKKVDFLICGTQKGGTTALYSYLSKHPEISLPNRKEVHFFDNDRLFFYNYSFYPIYHSFFNFKKQKKIYGEATPIYMYWKESPERMWKYNSGLKIIIILRNPVERAFSQWNMFRSQGKEYLSFSDALKRDLSKIVNHGKQSRIAYIKRGFYTEQLERIWKYFPKEQTLVLKNEDLKENPEHTLKKVTEFLGIEPIESIVYKEIHSLDYDSDMSNKDRNYLLTVYRDEINKLEKLLGWDCSSWLGN